MTEGKVQIHGKIYLTVAYRVAQLRETCTDWGIETEIVENGDSLVVMKAIIKDPEGRVIGTGYAEENRNSSQINRTSALENCETSAIGRALAACGYGGTEYASANEVENAVHQQVSPDPINMKRVETAITFFKEHIDKDNMEENYELIQAAHSKLTSDERIKVREGLKEKAPDSNKMYSTLLREYCDYNPKDLIPEEIPGL